MPEFLNLSLTCHFLHWRMFTFCRCYAPYTATVAIDGIIIKNTETYDGVLQDVYFFNGTISHNLNRRSRDYFSRLNGFRGILAQKPVGLKKPFCFDFLELVVCVREAPSAESARIFSPVAGKR